MFIGRPDAEAEAPILWPPDRKNWLIGKDPEAGKDWRREEKGMTEDEMVGWHHQLNGQQSEQTSRDGEGQGSLVCCSPWSRKEWATEQLQPWFQGVTWEPCLDCMAPQVLLSHTGHPSLFPSDMSPREVPNAYLNTELCLRVCFLLRVSNLIPCNVIEKVIFLKWEHVYTVAILSPKLDHS